MNIFYITQFFYPERVAASFRAYEHAKVWSEKNNKVTIFTAYPNFPTGKLFKGYKMKLIKEENINGLKVLRNKIVIKPNTNLINRAVNYLSFPFFGLWNIIFNKKYINDDYDLVLATSGTIFAPIIGYYYAKKNKLPFILELRDITYNQILATGGSKSSFVYKLIKKIELFLCKKADKIVTVTEGFKLELIKDGIKKEKIEVIYNGVNIKDKYNILDNVKTKNNELVFSYFGAFGRSQNLVNIVKFINKLKIDGKFIRIILIGDGAEKNNLVKYKKDNNLDNVTILGSKDQKELEEYYAISDFCMVVLKNNKYFKNTIPSKIFQIMGKRPILFIGPEGEASKIIKESGAGICLTHNRWQDNFKEFNKYISDNNNLDLVSKKGLVYVKQKYDRKLLANKYIEVFQNVTKKININN